MYVHGGLQPTSFSVVLFNVEGPRLIHLTSPDSLTAQLRPEVPVWIRVMGLSDEQAIRAMLEPLQVPPELLPPLLEAPQRPRVNSLGEALVVVLHRMGFSHDPHFLLSSQVGFLLLPGRLITFEETAQSDAFPQLTEWLLKQMGATEDRDLDDILHFLVDEVLDQLFPMIELLASRIDGVEEQVLRDPRPHMLAEAFNYRSNLCTIRSQVWPLRHEIQILLRQRQALLGPEALDGFRDMSELVGLLFDSTELLRHQCDAITQAYAASVGNRMNQVMKTLTIVASIFAPLTFIAGVYGMNFDNMPELHLPYAYFVVMALMAAVAGGQAYWLWRRGWFQDWTKPHR